MGNDFRNKRALRFAVSGALLLGTPAGLSACGEEPDPPTANEVAPEDPPAAERGAEEAAPETAENPADVEGAEESALPVGRPPGTRPTSNMTAPPREPRPLTMGAADPSPDPTAPSD